MENTENAKLDSCPCEAVKELGKIVERHDMELSKVNVQFAVLDTKMNIVLGVMSAIGIAICGVLIKFILNF